jgi:hypothetical protein
MDLRGFAFSAARRARYIAVLINEVQELVIPVHGILHQNLRLAVASLRLLANVPATINEIQICLVIALKIQLLHFFGHFVLTAPWIQAEKALLARPQPNLGGSRR